MRSLLLLALTLAPFSAAAQALLHPLPSPTGTPEGEFGYDVSGVGDVDHDGVSDLLIGAPNEAPPGSPQGAGRAHVYSGATGELLYSLQSPGEQQGGAFGYAVSGVPDLDGDARGDLLVSAFREGVGGRAYVFSGVSGLLLHTFDSPNGDDQDFFGWEVAGVGDVDGDGMGDLVVGLPGDYLTSLTGAAYVYSGASGALLYELVSPNPEASGYFGAALSGVPDVDGDGRTDLLVGALYEDPGASPQEAGRAYLFSGATGDLLHTLVSPGEEHRGRFGNAVAGVPDVDGDGKGDLLIGALLEGPGGEPRGPGRAHLFSGASGTLLYTMASPNEDVEGFFGTSVAGVDDVDGDGRGDLLIGAFAEDPDGSPLWAGRAYVFDGASGTPLYELASAYSQAFGFFGGAVASVGDVDGDGHGDLLVGAANEGPGRAYLFSGARAVDLDAFAYGDSFPRGGRLRFRVVVTNATTLPLSGDLTLDVSGPDGSSYSHLLITDGMLEPAETRGPRFRLHIGRDTPLGLYTATVTALDGGVRAAGNDSFTFEVVAGAVPRGEATGVARGFGPVEVEDGGFGTAEAPRASVRAPAQAAFAPNPAQGQATLAFSLAEPGTCRLALFDALGREIAAVETGRLAVGSQRIPVDLSALPVGVYVWRLTSGAQIFSGRLTVAR